MWLLIFDIMVVIWYVIQKISVAKDTVKKITFFLLHILGERDKITVDSHRTLTLIWAKSTPLKHSQQNHCKLHKDGNYCSAVAMNWIILCRWSWPRRLSGADADVVCITGVVKQVCDAAFGQESGWWCFNKSQDTMSDLAYWKTTGIKSFCFFFALSLL